MLKSIVWSFLALGVASGAALADEKLWIHVRVVGDEEDEKVSINLPVALVESILPMIESNEFDNGRIRIDDEEWDAADLKKIWEQLSAAEDGEFLTIEKRDENVRIAKEKGILRLVAEDADEGDDVEMQIPVEVIEAMLSSPAAEEDEIDLAAGLRALRPEGPPIIVRAEDEESMVRIWVDDRQNGLD